MKISRYVAILLLAVGVLMAPCVVSAQIQVVGDGEPGPVKAQHLTVEMVSLAPSIAPGGSLDVGLVITLEEKWHVYWINAGDSGEPPKIHWTLPRGISAGPMQFPIPTRLPLGPLMDFGYEDEVAFPVKLNAAKDLKAGPIHLDAKIDWLVCREVCIPGKAHLGLNLTVDPKASASPQPVGALGKALGLIPKQPGPEMKVAIHGGKKDFVIDLISGDRTDRAEFFPIDQEQIANAGEQQVEPLPDGLRLRVPRAPELTKLPASLHGIIKLDDEDAIEINAPVVAGEIAGRAASSTSGESKSADLTATAAIGLAFVGGLILNLMPCVFPVLFLKGLSLVQATHEDRRQTQRHGLVYTLGILVSFWAIVAVLLVVRAGGSEAGWGFQLQSPTFLTILASAIFLFALSLAGLFDIGLSLTSVGGGLAQKQGYTGSFFTGVLATVVATPCTAPFMGAAIGFAIAQPAWITFAVFTALALGLAAPYLLLSFQPTWARWLPKPGAWMEIFKQITAAIFFATVIWLTYVYGSLFASQGVYRASLLLTCFLLLGVAGWILGRWPAKWSSSIAACVVGAIALSVPLYQPKDQTLTWAAYSPEALQQAKSTGRPVFIDFTAAWCLSCQVNEKVVLKSGDVQRELRDRNVVLLKADWTQYDPGITKELSAVGRSGVPTYVIYPSGDKSPHVLPELLTKGIVLEALRKDAM